MIAMYYHWSLEAILDLPDWRLEQYSNYIADHIEKMNQAMGAK